jgi:hypothetical protein
MYSGFNWVNADGDQDERENAHVFKTRDQAFNAIRTIIEVNGVDPDAVAGFEIAAIPVYS